jgi:hypothetical protein
MGSTCQIRVQRQLAGRWVFYGRSANERIVLSRATAAGPICPRSSIMISSRRGRQGRVSGSLDDALRAIRELNG